jgi:hypothetical protein
MGGEGDVGGGDAPGVWAGVVGGVTIGCIKSSKGPVTLSHVTFSWRVLDGGDGEGKGGGGGGGIVVEVEVEGFDFVSRETGVMGQTGYLVLLVGHVRVVTAFEPHARTSLSRDKMAQISGGRGVMVTAALFWPDGKSSGKISSVMVSSSSSSSSSSSVTVAADDAERAPHAQTHRQTHAQTHHANPPTLAHRAHRVYVRATHPKMEAAEAKSKLEAKLASEEAFACYMGGAACDSVCAWEGVVPKACDNATFYDFTTGARDSTPPLPPPPPPPSSIPQQRAGEGGVAISGWATGGRGVESQGKSSSLKSASTADTAGVWEVRAGRDEDGGGAGRGREGGVSVVVIVERGEREDVGRIVLSLLRALRGTWPVEGVTLVACSPEIASRLAETLPQIFADQAGGFVGAGAREGGGRVEGGGRDGGGWGVPFVEVLQADRPIGRLEAVDVGFRASSAPFVFFALEGVEFVAHGLWLAESMGIMRDMAHIAAVTVIDHAQLLTPLKRAERTGAKHAFFRFATNWRSPDAGLRYASVSRSLLLLNRSSSRSLLTLTQTSGTRMPSTHPAIYPNTRTLTKTHAQAPTHPHTNTPTHPHTHTPLHPHTHTPTHPHTPTLYTRSVPATPLPYFILCFLQRQRVSRAAERFCCNFIIYFYTHSVAATLWRRAAYEDALQGAQGGGEGGGGSSSGGGLAWFQSMENSNVFLRLTGYEV